MSAQTIATFNLPELFGTTWPTQNIEMNYPGANPGSGAKMIGPDGMTEVPYQWEPALVCSDSASVTGCVIVQSGLPANANYTWTLTTGTPSASPTNPVVLTSNSTYYTMTNGLTGVRIIAPASNGTPFNKSPIQGLLLADGTTWIGQDAAQNLIYTESVANAGNIGNSPLQTPAYTVTGYSVSVVVQGPIKTVVQASYTFNRPQYFVGSTVLSPPGAGHYTMLITMYANSKSILIDEDGDMMMQYLIPTYTGVTPDTIQFRAHDSQGFSPTVGSTSIAECGYEAPLTVIGATNTNPIVIATSAAQTPPLLSTNQQCAGAGCTVTISGVGGNTAANGQFFFKTQGFDSTHFALYHDNNFLLPVDGTSSGAYTSGGIVKDSYRGQYLNPTQDGLLDLTYNVDRQVNALCNENNGGFWSYRNLTTDYPATEPAAPWYFMEYQQSGGSSAPIVGVYQGRFSKQIMSAVGPSQPGPYTTSGNWIAAGTHGYIQVPTLMRGGAGNLVCTGTLPCADPIVHRNWGLYISTKADALALSQTQPISIEQNMMTGINLSRLYSYQFSYPDPVGGWKPLYMTPAAFNTLSATIINGTSQCGSSGCYANLLRSSETSTWGVNLVNMIQGNSTASVQSAVDTLATAATAVTNVLACVFTGSDNRFNNPIGQYQLGLTASPANSVMNAILLNSNTTLTQKNQIKAIIALFGNMFWDNDWFPVDNNSGGSGGTFNQAQQYLQYRTQFVATLQSNPSIAAHTAQALASMQSSLTTDFSTTGAVTESTHYEGTIFQPLDLDFAAFQLQGLASMATIWPAEAQWELGIQTPPEPRFGNIRKGVSIGQGNTESDVRLGMLATSLESVNPSLAGNLMWAWTQSNRNGTSLGSILTEDSQFVSTIPAIDNLTLAPITPNLTSINIPGYFTNERFNFGTNNETSVWTINGDVYIDHRHSDDGQTTIYPLRTPLSVDYNPNIDLPNAGGRWIHSSTVFDSELGSNTWSDDNTDINLASIKFPTTKSTEFESFTGSTEALSSYLWTDGMTTWLRRTRTFNFNPAYPVIYVEDTYTGPSAAAAKTITWNMMDNGGAITTPAGPITTVKRFSIGCQSPAGQFPSNGTVNNLTSGLQRFTFTGASWAAHPSGGINWDFWVSPPDNTTQFLIGNWGHGCQDSRDTAEYEVANSVGSFSEIQDILRIHDTGTSMVSIFAPYDKGSTPTRTVSVQICGTQFVQGSETTCFNDHSATFTNGVKGIVTAYDSSSANGFGATLSGGSQEVVLNNSSSPTQLTWTISGAQSGIRQVTIPGGWTPSPPNPSVIASGNTYSFNFTGGLQATPSTITLIPSGTPPVNPQGKTIVATAGVPVQICANCQPPKSRACTISALSTNAGTIWIGFNSGVSAASMLGTPLGPPTVAGQPGASYSCRPAGDSSIWPLGEMWIDATNSGDGVSYSWN